MNKKVALVLSGGGARGIAHIGVIEELVEQGFEITSISGTSMGALVGGVYAAGTMQDYKEWIYTIDKMKIFHLVDFTFSSQGLIKGDRLFKKMKDFVRDQKIEDLNINYAATATDIKNNKEIVFTKGSLLEAIRASIAIPTVFTPVVTNNSILVDGGVMDNVPVKHVKKGKNDLLVVVYVNADIPVDKPKESIKEKEKKKNIYLQKIKELQENLPHLNPKNRNEKMGYFDLINKSMSIMNYQIAMNSIKKSNPDMLIQTSRHACGVFDFYKADELVEMGRTAAKKSIEAYLKEKIDKS